MDSDTAYWFEQLSNQLQQNAELLQSIEAQVDALREALLPEDDVDFKGAETIDEVGPMRPELEQP